MTIAPPFVSPSPIDPAADAASLLPGSAEREALRAIVGTLLDGAPCAGLPIGAAPAAGSANPTASADPCGDACDLALGQLARKLSLLSPAQRQDALRALEAMCGRTLVLLGCGRWTRFDSLSSDDRVRCLVSWGTSRLAPLRSAYQLVRRLVLSSHYSRADVLRAIGYAGPLHLRAPLVEWEGVLDGIAREDEPVARVPGRHHLPASTRTAETPGAGRVIDARTLAGGGHLTADAVVIGSGAGGAVSAALLAEQGLRVVVLEEGEWHHGDDFTEEDALMLERLYADAAMRATDDLSISLLQGRTAGGSSTVNWMIMLRTPDHVLDEWSRAHGASGMSPAELRAVFERIEREVHATAVPDDAHSENNRVLLQGARALGWRASSANINARGCTRCGFCGGGCRYGAKQSVLETYLPRALRAGATLYTSARAERIELIERGQPVGTPPLKRVSVALSGGHGGTLHVDAPLVMLAGGAVGTPVLLQRSGFGGDAVGDYLRLHPTTMVCGEFDRPIVPSTGIALSTICDEHTRWQGSDYGFWIECPPVHPTVGAVALPGFGQPHASLMERLPRTAVFIALTRDGADGRSSGRVRAGRDGRVSIRYRLSAEDARRVRASLRAAAELQLAAGAIRVTTTHTRTIEIRTPSELDRIDRSSLAPNDVALFSAHLNGTCRLGVDRRSSGATPDGERHGLRGVYIVDGSLLPTAPGVNPQETIMALSTVITERAIARHGARTHG
jgi:choline dehydrogenase-like flavoprotein